MNNSGRNLSQNFKWFFVICWNIISTFLHLFSPVQQAVSSHSSTCSPQYTQAVSSHSSICSPSAHTSSIITFLHLFTIITHKQFHHIYSSVHIQHTQAVSSLSSIFVSQLTHALSSHSSFCSLSVHPNTDNKAFGVSLPQNYEAKWQKLLIERRDIEVDLLN